MTSLVAQERALVVFGRGEIRDQILQVFRNGLRRLVNPRTNQPFNEDDIQAATGPQTRFYIEASAIDLAMMAAQRRALFLADQVRPDRAATGFLRGYHAPTWGEDYLPAVGASGFISIAATGISLNSTLIGSLEDGDPVATKFRAGDGTILQVRETTFVFEGGTGSDIPVKAISTGVQTNLAAGTKLSDYENVPLGITGEVTVQAQMTGGSDAETDGDFAARLMDRIANKPAAGNAAQFRSWARVATTTIEDAFVYPCALQAGSVVVAVTAKRGVKTGPNARIPSQDEIDLVVAYLTPPSSPVVPAHPYVLVVAPVATPANMAVTLAMRSGSSSGWLDQTAWPPVQLAGNVVISSLVSQTAFSLVLDPADPAPNVTAPSLMVWNATKSEYELLDVTSVTDSGGGNYDVVLNTAPSFTIANGDVICPGNGRRAAIARSITAYFDSLGPGEIVADTDPRWHRAYRQPEPFDVYPQNNGTGIGRYLFEGLDQLVASVTVAFNSLSSPAVADPADGPNLITAGKIGVYPE